MNPTLIVLLLAFYLGLVTAGGPGASTVNPFPGEDWNTGYIDVGNGNSLFYYLFRSRNKTLKAAPLTIWLEGGPGASTAMGVFSEGGPVTINNKTKAIESNPYAWNIVGDTLFVDQPAGTLFSIAQKEERMCRDEVCVTNDFYSFLLGFYARFPEYKGRELYVSGVSYGGHYVPAIAGRIIKEGNKDINLKGIAIGNGLVDLYTQLPSYPEFLYEKGLINMFQYLGYHAAALACHIANELQIKTLDLPCVMIFFNLYDSFKLGKDRYDVTETESIYAVYQAKLDPYLNEPDVQKALGVNVKYVGANMTVLKLMMGDWKYSLSPEVVLALERGIKVFLYFGENDYVCNFLGGEYLADSLEWSGKEEFLKQKYVDWKLGDLVPATMRRYGNLSLIRVKGAGHTIFFKQRPFSLELLKDLIKHEAQKKRGQ